MPRNCRKASQLYTKQSFPAGWKDGKANVKSIMAKFNNNAAEDVHCHQVRTGGHPPLAKKAAFEKFAQLENAGLSSKPNSFYKPTLHKLPPSTKPGLHDASGKDFKTPPLQNSPVASKVKMLAEAASREANEKTTYPKPSVPKISEGLREETKPVFPKIPEKKLSGSPPHKNEPKPLEQRLFKPEPRGSEAKPAFPTVAGVKEKFNSTAQENNSKPLFPKPPIKQKPSQSFTQDEEVSNKSASFNQVSPSSSGLKSKAGSIRPLKDPQDKSRNESHPIIPFPPLKPVSNQNNLPQILPKSVGQQNEEAKPKPIKNIFLQNKQEDSGSTSGTIAAKLANSSRTVKAGPWANNTGKEDKDKDKNLPRRKTLPSTIALGQAPQKPNRPPTVDLEKFRRSHGEGSSSSNSAGLPPPLPPPIHATQSTDLSSPPPPPPPPPGFRPSTQTPVLPPRGNIPSRPDLRGQENEENYDDVGFGSEDTGNADENSDGEMYEDINEMRFTSQEEEKKKEKEEKKKSDQKKEQRDKDKKEQELRKKFKLEGPIEVIHQARASTDFKGGKYDLSFKQGDLIEILRITDNPEGKWLGRLKGSYGYIKTTMVAIDYDTLKRKPRPPVHVQSKHSDSDQEVYDDVGDHDSISSGSQSTGGFPPPPPDDIYDGVEDDEIPAKSVSQDEEKSDTWSKGLLKILKGKDYQKKSMREAASKVNVTEDENSLRSPSAKQTGKDSGDSDVYDDVESTDFPPPPKEISLGKNIISLNFGRGRSDERDSQKFKKIDKEEKDFRKKFKYEGDIRVLYTTAISKAPTPKKRGSKDLQVKPGELVEVIQDVDDTKVLCRNEEGKYGYVQRSCLVHDDEEIYDDIADDLYDND
ncbi:FYN-binding protein 1 isoform X1 [Pantherophis guttatus]|uniref:FYN-binding protein 1 n=1 Tax=Pantherophis guttatus TaxID=94885 RepID=A0A6P9DLF7_PANGU|nr:FYN-binding protein 1 isoform X1 [Pantherophis guttatus]